MTAALMIQGTGSDVGKSLIVAGLCRAYARRGLRVRPFKPQNMSNNAAVTRNGGEIGRAQALQARACGVEASIDMNPILLKPQTEVGAQVVVQGRVQGNARAREYQAMKAGLLPKALESYHRLSGEADLLLVEGAGSPAEINLRAGDVANMGFAEAAGVPVVLLGDIDRGGVIAQIVGTWELLGPADRRWLRGYAINKFRGDISLFDNGLVEITKRTGLPSYGVVPHFPEARLLPAEDAVALENPSQMRDGPIRIAVPMLSRIANFDDFDPLAAEPDVHLHMVRPGEVIPADVHLIVLPGSKATLADLAFLRAQGWDIDILAHHRRGGLVLGICGGYQMLGRVVRDPDGIEGDPGEAEGLGLLDVETILTGEKRLTQVQDVVCDGGYTVGGYHMHMGRTEGPARTKPLLEQEGQGEGAISPDGRVMGCYLHGLFGADEFRHSFLSRLVKRNASGVNYEQQVDLTLDRLADHLETHMDLNGLLALAQAPQQRRTA